MSLLALLALAASASAQAEPVALSARDREGIEAAFRTTWPDSYRHVRQQAGDWPAQAPALTRVEVVECRGQLFPSPAMPVCQLTLTVRTATGRVQNTSLLWRFLRTETDEWYDPVLFNSRRFNIDRKD